MQSVLSERTHVLLTQFLDLCKRTNIPLEDQRSIQKRFDQLHLQLGSLMNSGEDLLELIHRTELSLVLIQIKLERISQLEPLQGRVASSL